MTPMLTQVLLPEELVFDAATISDLPMLRGSDLSMVIAILCDATATILVLLRKIQVPFHFVLPLRILLVYTSAGINAHHLNLYSWAWGLGIFVHTAATLLHLFVEHGAWPLFPRVGKELLPSTSAKVPGQAREAVHADSDESKRSASLNGAGDDDSGPCSPVVCPQHVRVEDAGLTNPPTQPPSPTLLQSLPQQQLQPRQLEDSGSCLAASTPAVSGKLAPSGSQAVKVEEEEDARVTRLQLNYVQCCMRASHRGPKYRSSFKHHKVTLKMPCHSGPSSLAPDALPKFGENIRSMTDTEVLSAVVRAGCILLTADLRDNAALAGSQRNSPQHSLEQAVAGAAQEWLLDTHLAEQLPHSGVVMLQVEDRIFKCQLPDFIGSMSPVDSCEGLGKSPLSICAAVPSMLLPSPDPPATSTSEVTASTACRQQHVVGSPAASSASSARSEDGSLPPGVHQHSQGSSHAAACSDVMVVRAWVRRPVGAELCGWRSQRPAESKAARGAEFMLHVLACTKRGYISTSVEVVPAEPCRPSPNSCQDAPPPEGLEDVQVSISIPTAAAHTAGLHMHPSWLRLELWRSHTLCSCSTLLLLPACLAGARAVVSELQHGPPGEGAEAEFMENLAGWMADHGHQLELQQRCPDTLQSPELSTGSSSGSERPQQQLLQQGASGASACPSAMGARDVSVGVSLLRQAVLWGMPCLSSLLVECLMARQPEAPTFAALMRAGARVGLSPHFPPWHVDAHTDAESSASAAGAAGAPASVQGGPMPDFSIEDLGSLLHLCLLCPRPEPMLAALLRWGERFAGRDAEQQFWPVWEEHNRLGLAALDILAGCTREDQGMVLSTLLLRAPAQYAFVTRALRQEQAGACPPLMQQPVPVPACPASPVCRLQSVPLTKAATVHGHVHSSSIVPVRSTQHSVWLTAAWHSLGGGLWRYSRNPEEAAYLAWAHNYTLPLSRVRFVLLLLGCLVGISRSISNGIFYGDVLLMYSITAAYLWGIVKRQHKAGTRLARYGHILMWGLLGLGILPMENNTKTMVATYSESFVLFALFSPLLEQSTLGYLLLERLSTTIVYVLIFKALGVSAGVALVRAVASNAVSALAEWVFIDVNLRYAYLKGQVARQQFKAD